MKVCVWSSWSFPFFDYRKKWIGENLDKVMSDYLVKQSEVVNTDDEATDEVELEDLQPIEE